MTADAPRLAPLPEEQWGDDQRRLLEEHAATLTYRPLPNSVTTLMHHPRLASVWFGFNAYLLRTPALGHRLRELAILRVTWRTRSTYMWHDHVRYALNAGLTEDDLASVTAGPDDDRWSPVEAEVVRATDELLDHQRIGEATWARLAEHLDEAQLLELPFIVGAYLTLGMVYESARTEVDEFLREFPAPTFARPAQP